MSRGGDQGKAAKHGSTTSRRASEQGYFTKQLFPETVISRNHDFEKWQVGVTEHEQ